MRPIFIIIFSLIVLPQGYCQREANSVWFHSPTTLPNYAPSYNYFVYHDSEGFVWISSTAGLNRFDGARVKHYSADISDSTSLFTGENIQSSLFEDHEKNLWFSTAEALHCYQRKTDDFRHFNIKGKDGSPIRSDYHVFFLEQDSMLWLVAGESVFRLNIHKPNSAEPVLENHHVFLEADTAQDGSVSAIYKIGNVQSSGFGYWEIDHGKVKSKKDWFSKNPTFPMPSRVLDRVKDSDSLVWLGTDLGLFAWNPKDASYKMMGGRAIGDCYIEAWGSTKLAIWSLKEGLLIFDKSQETFQPLDVRRIDGQKISVHDVFNIYLDNDENLWVSSKGSGVIHANLNKTKFKSMPKTEARDGSTTYSYWSSYWDSKGRFWHGSISNGLFRLDGNGNLQRQYLHEKNNPASLPNDWVTTVLEDAKKRIWVGTAAGLVWTDAGNDGRFEAVLPVGTKDAPFIVNLLRLKSRPGILASTLGRGVFLLEENAENLALSPATAESGAYGILFEDHLGRIYSSKDEAAIHVFGFEKKRLKLLKQIPVNGIVNGYYEDRSGKTLWIASLSGLIKIDLDSLKIQAILTEKDGLPDKNIHALLADDFENLWLSTPKGLVVYERKSGGFRQFSMADGTQSQEFQWLAGAKRQGELWFGGSNGLTVVPSNYNFVNGRKPTVRITAIKINDIDPVGLTEVGTGVSNVSQIRHIELPFEDNTFSLEFTAIEYSDPTGNRLKYKLMNADDDWVELKRGELGFARYAGLRENKYTFMVKGISSDGAESDAETMLTITIKPPIYRTIPFYVLIAVLIGGGAFLWFRRRVTQIKETAQLKTRVAENKMAALRSQMNPHFVFNSLQTVNVFITKQDLRGAIEYVNQFARLMRVILENSRTNLISLENEIELLELYLKIESRRFSTPFTYSITVGKDLDTFGTQIPPMLLQPFVENAIKHGLFHKKEQGHIGITFHRENGYLKCAVEDNGVGRAKSRELNGQQGRPHKSRGLEIVKERLEIIWADRSKTHDFKIIDLADLQQNASGTRVEIMLPLS